MSTTAPAPRSATPGRPSQQARQPSLSDITSKGRGLPGRYVLYGTEGCGKTSFGAQMPNPVFIQTKGETGLETLIDAGRLSDVPHFPECQSFKELLAMLDELASADHDYKTLVLDTLNGVEPMCHEYVKARDFENDAKKFEAYKAGLNVSLGAWRELLFAFDRVRSQKRMTTLILAHAKVATFKNPSGEDYDRYTIAMHDKASELVRQWADAVLFVNFDVVLKEERGKRAKGFGGQSRTMYCEHHAAWDAKNRHGLPEEIDLGDSPEQAFQNFKAAMAAGRKVSE